MADPSGPEEQKQLVAGESTDHENPVEISDILAEIGVEHGILQFGRSGGGADGGIAQEWWVMVLAEKMGSVARAAIFSDENGLTPYRKALIELGVVLVAAIADWNYWDSKQDGERP